MTGFTMAGFAVVCGVVAVVIVAASGFVAEWIDRRDHRKATERKRAREGVNHHAPSTEAHRRRRAG